MKRLLALIIISIIALTTASAQQEDFNAFGPVLIKTFQCTPQQFQITITNTGVTASTYYLEVEGSAAKWIRFAPASIFLNPGQTAEIQSFLDTPCNAHGTYNLNIYILNSYGLEKVIAQEIRAEKPLNADIKAKVFSQEIPACQTAKYEATVINPAQFTETYKLSIDSFKKESKLSHDQITLQAGASQDIIIEITPKNCEQTGEHNIIFAAKAEKTGTKAEIDLQLKIKETSIPVIAEGINSIKTNLNEESIAELSITNKGKETGKYQISIDGLSWATTDTEHLTIAPQESEKIKIYLRPAETLKKGNYPLKITAEDEEGSKFTKEIQIQLRSPTFIGKIFSEYLLHTIAVIIIFALAITGVYFASRKFTSQEYSIARAKRKKEREKKKAELKKEQEKIKAEQEKEKQKKQKEIEKAKEKAIQKYDQQIRTQYELISKEDIAAGKTTPTHWLRNLVLFFTILILLTITAAFRSTLWANKFYALLGLAILAALLIIRQLAMLGKTTAKWRGIILANEALLMHVGWKKGLHQISFSLDSPAKNAKVTAKKGRTRHAQYVQPKEFAYKYFSVISNVQDIDIKEAKYRFKVSKSWLKKNTIKEEDVALAALRQGSYSKLKTTREGADAKYVYYKAATDSFGQFAIVGKTSAKEKQKRYWTILLAIIILAVLGTGILLIITSEKPAIPVKGIPPQIWSQDTQHSLELSKYFSDPDGDKLTYTFPEISSISTEVKNGIAYFTPDKGWSGQRIITFTANDGKGGTADSNPVQLIVKKKIFPQAYAGYLKYILAGIILLILILTVMILKNPVMKWLEEDF